ncbi:hypothetical protein [Desulfotomaculum sp. OF05-3]|uniref:hypothetical protein n=1 Tax=Desulfotomaculum sp. OF05-3 TaxID=2305243 RepID=UPI0011C145E6|nr:hypothetical protein [Desulfotomaculum sp. OF05-3]
MGNIVLFDIIHAMVKRLSSGMEYIARLSWTGYLILTVAQLTFISDVRAVDGVHATYIVIMIGKHIFAGAVPV